MSGVFKAIGTVAGIAAAIPGPHQPIAAAIAVTANIGAALTATKPPVQGSTTEVTIGADQPRPMMLGDTYSPGARVLQRGYGGTVDKVVNPYAAIADVYSAGGPIAGIDQVLVDFEEVTFDTGGEANGHLDDYFYRQISLGPVPQTAALTGHWGAIPGFDASAAMSGLAHILYSLEFDPKGKKFASGVPQLGIRGRGVKTWDPRKDSTFPGGSGAQRWADPANTTAFDAAKATWVYTYRPGLHGLRYALGTWERDPRVSGSKNVLTFGVGLKLDQIVVEDFAALETICEANGWEVSAVIYEPGDKWANLKRILEAGGAEPCWKGGRLGLKVTAPRVSLDTITRDDLAEGDIRAQGASAWRDVVNTVIPKAKSPAHKWELQQSTKITVPALVTQDGEEKPKEVPFETVKSATQAAQLAAYALWASREFGPVELPILPRLRSYRGGDRLTLHADIVTALGLPHGEVVVVQRAWNPATMTGVLTVMGETASKHAFALGQVGAFPPTISAPTAADFDGAAGSGSPRAAYRFIDQSVAYPVQSDDTSVSVTAFSGTLDDGTTLALPAAKKGGLASGATFGVFWDLEGAATAETAAFDFTGATLPSGVTLTRASSATRVNASGARVTAAADVARFDYLAGALRGLLVEPARTNAFLQSTTLTTSWTASALVADPTALIEAAVAGQHQVTQTVGFTTGQPVTISCVASERSGSAKRYLGIFVPAAVAGALAGATFNLAAGTASVTGPAVATITATAGGWLCAVTVTPTATVSAAAGFRLSTAAGAIGGAYTGNGSAGLNVSEMQCETGATASSRIRTTTAAVTRAADVVTIAWGDRDVPDGTISTTVTFDDGSTQIVPVTLTAGKAVLPTALDRPWVRSVQTPFTRQPYVVVPAAAIGASIADSRYVWLGKVATSTGGVFPPDDTPPGGWGGTGSGGGVIP